MEGVLNLFRGGRKKGGDGKYFSSTKRGEIGELKSKLADREISVMKDAVKKVIANVTVGKDMSAVFPNVVNCMRTESLEIKKLVYLYLINYAKSNPDLAIMAVNSFVKDAEHPNPMIRALAIRTMGCIRVQQITDYLGAPLQKALVDEDPYVRKTAAVCVAKLHDISPTMAWEQGFVTMLQDMVSDAVPTVVANAVAALHEIQENSGRAVLEITTATLQKLQAALNVCNEWGQVFILDLLAGYHPQDAREAESICDRVLPHLQHQNSAVVLSSTKVVMRLIEHIPAEDTVAAFCRKLAPPLVTLAQSQHPEVQYIALRNISLVVQKRQNLLAGKAKVFFCKYNDPIYVKMEKLEILVRLANDKNLDDILLELREYAQEVDVEYVRRAVRTIGRIAIKLQRAPERCIRILLQLIKSRVSYVVQEAVVVMRDIFRRYPNRFESVISVLCEALETLDEPEAKAALVWIIGEYGDRIDNAPELLEGFLENFADETAQVQLALLTAIVKVYLQREEDAEELVQQVLHKSTEESDNPDLRDRGYVYWRLIAADPDAARAVVLAQKPVIEDDTYMLSPALLDELLADIGMLSSVYHKPASAFVHRTRRPGEFAAGGEEEEEEEDDEEEESDDEEEEEGEAGPAAGGGGAMGAPEEDADLFDLDGGAAGGAEAGAAGGEDDGMADLFGGGGGGGDGAVGASSARQLTLPEMGSSGGLTLCAACERSAAGPVLKVQVRNDTDTSIDQCQIRLNVNAYGLAPSQQAFYLGGVNAGGVGEATVDLTTREQARRGGADPSSLQVAIRVDATGTAFKFRLPVSYAKSLLTMDEASASVARGDFRGAWTGVPEAGVAKGGVRSLAGASPAQVQQRLQDAGFFYIADKVVGGETRMLYFSARGPGVDAASGMQGALVLLEATFKRGFDMCKLVVKSQDTGAAKATLAGLSDVVLAQ